MYRTLIKPVVTYGTETWTLRKMDENSPIIFERKVLGKISSQRRDLRRMENLKNRELKEIYPKSEYCGRHYKETTHLGRTSMA